MQGAVELNSRAYMIQGRSEGRVPILQRVLAAPFQKREVKCDKTGVK